ncbi:VWA domain-containing protein [Mycobacterium sp. 852013-51886_SCH5428379]|uniref:nitric oxide reductase activation protein NorD n=1 Tax=Mycobacterium sp. 852013-51886_SCH5428379 TaxID=1834111 RepID=UPI0007FB88D0|nr:VWA domain-containing protein [Mycobacterium sp. 852013-51886_SCH5428379]OBB55925.1 VWA domain-containing protein [Mycobacterium sp. 852013-51886_SCH5428379]
MNAESCAPQHFRLLASFLAARRVDVAVAPAGGFAYTDGQIIYVSANADPDRQRREVLLQSALLGAGSLDGRYVKRLRARPPLARRYLALEGHRVLDELGRRVPLAAAVGQDFPPRSASSEESLQIAAGRMRLDAPPDWFGTIKPSKLVGVRAGSGSPATDTDVLASFELAERAEIDEDHDDEGPPEKSWILKLFEVPLGTQAPARFLRKLFGGARSSGSETAGGELGVGSMKRTSRAGVNARPLPTPIRFTGDDKPGAGLGVGGALYPEWDVFGERYREDWCRVVDFPVAVTVGAAATGAARDAALRRRLARVGLGPRALRARTDGDELDTEALIDLFVDLRSGHSPLENVYIERRRIARNLGVLILVDASGSATDADGGGLAVHEHQRRAAATLAATLEELGDRVAVYGFRSQGRHAVHLPVIKSFSERFGARALARLGDLQPSGYTRLGAGIRGAGEILKAHAGTPHRLLLVLSDGFPYDDGYEGRYAEADSRKALEELRTDGMGCLCLSIGATADAAALERLFGSASHASAPSLADLSPRMDVLFLSALRELAAPKPRGG